jgi:hypothetical protein
MAESHLCCSLIREGKARWTGTIREGFLGEAALKTTEVKRKVMHDSAACVVQCSRNVHLSGVV